MEFKSPAEYFFKINQQFNWIVAAPLAIFVFLSLEWRTDQWKSLIAQEPLKTVLVVGFMLICLILWYVGFQNYRVNNKAIHASHRLEEKMGIFQKGYTKMQIYFTVSALISMAGLYLTGSNFFAAYYIILLFYVSINRPSPAVVSKALKLNKEDRDILIRKKEFKNES